MNHRADEALNRYYNLLKQSNDGARDNLFAKLADSSQSASLATEGVAIIGVRRSKVNAATFRRFLFTKKLFEVPWLSSRVIVAALLLITFAVGFSAFVDTGSRTAWAAMVDAIQGIRSAKYRCSIEMPNSKGIVGHYWSLPPGRFRQESDNGLVVVADYGARKMLNLQTNAKTALVIELKDVSKDGDSNDYFDEVRRILLKEKMSPNTTRESLGAKRINGRDAIGYRIVSPERTTVIWGDSVSGLPSLIEITKSKNLLPGTKVTLSEFEFNAKLDESLFSVDPPAGYTVQNLTISAAEPTEEDLLGSLRSYSERAHGTFPKSLDTNAFQDLAKSLGLDKKLPEGKAMDEWMELCTNLSRGFAFALGLPAEARATYAGQDAKLNTSDRPIFWYKPVGSKKYRVIVADLTVRESVNEPVANNAKQLGETGDSSKPK